MNDISLWNTLKGDLSQYFYISRNMDPLETDIKNVSCYRLGAMLYLEIQKGKEEMNKSEFQNQIGGNMMCMKRLTRGKKGCG